jgi:hypothetical protein
MVSFVNHHADDEFKEIPHLALILGRSAQEGGTAARYSCQGLNVCPIDSPGEDRYPVSH